MTDMQAVIGIEQLKKIENWKKRKFIWDTYHEEFSTTNLKLTLRKVMEIEWLIICFDTT